MAQLYSGCFAFESDEEDDLGQQHRRPAIDPAVAAAAASPPPPLPRAPAAGGPAPLLYIRSERLAQLATCLPVNAERPALVHSLVEAYGLLEVRRRAFRRSAELPEPCPSVFRQPRGPPVPWGPDRHACFPPSHPCAAQGATVEEAPPASAQELLQFHSRDYLQALAAWERLSERQRAAAGLQDDCAPFPG